MARRQTLEQMFAAKARKPRWGILPHEDFEDEEEIEETEVSLEEDEASFTEEEPQDELPATEEEPSTSQKAPQVECRPCPVVRKMKFLDDPDPEPLEYSDTDDDLEFAHHVPHGEAFGGIHDDGQKYPCDMMKYGCKALLSAEDAEEHILRKCLFRFIKYCGFRTSHDCMLTFEDLEDNLQHLIENHPDTFLPSCNPMERFVVAYDRKLTSDDVEFTNIIRARLTSADKFHCLLMVEEQDNGKVRIYLLKVSGECGRLSALICIHKDDDISVQKIEAKLNVVPHLMMLNDPNPTTNGQPNYLELDNKLLDEKYCTVVDGQKRFGLLVCIVEHYRLTAEQNHDPTLRALAKEMDKTQAELDRIGPLLKLSDCVTNDLWEMFWRTADNRKPIKERLQTLELCFEDLTSRFKDKQEKRRNGNN